jgi:cell division FtsZ-interacting protein ZapD
VVKTSVLFIGSFLSIFFSYQYFALAENEGQNLDQRLNSLVTKHSIVLTDQDRANVVANCNKLQAQMTANQLSTAAQVRQRVDIYSNLQNEIKALELRMIRQGVDASELDLLIGKIQEKQDQIIITADQMGEIADDTRIIDCQQRPEQFKAGLAEYKDLQDYLLIQSRQLRILILTSPETTFNPLKKRLSL